MSRGLIHGPRERLPIWMNGIIRPRMAPPSGIGFDAPSRAPLCSATSDIGSKSRAAVRRYPLDKSRYEVMLEVTNTGPEPEDVELTLLGDGQMVDVTITDHHLAL